MAKTETRFTRRAGLMRNLTTAVLVLLVTGVTIDMTAAIRQADTIPWPLVVDRLPVIFYLSAIFAMRQGFAAFARGDALAPTLPTLFAGTGILLFIGGLVRVFGTPLLLRFGEGQTALANFDPAAVTVGVVGALLAMLAALLSYTVAARRELDEFL